MKTIILFLLFSLFYSIISFSISFEIPERSYSIVLYKDGSATVTERITYKIKQPFRYVSWAIDFEEPVKIEDLRVEVLQGPTPSQIIYDEKTIRNISLRVLFSRSMEEYVSVPNEGQIVEIAVSYLLRDILMEGKDFSQLFIKYIGKGTVVPTMLLKVRVVLPLEFGKPLIYHHPWGLHITRNDVASNIYEFTFRRVPKDTFVEGRFVFPQITNTETKYFIDASMSDVEKEEKAYLLKTRLLVVFAIIYVVVVAAFPFYVYRRYGREEKIDYQAEYEREIPYNDPPELVNAIVKRLCQTPDDDAISAAILDMVKTGEVEFVENQKREIVGIKILKQGKKRSKLIDCFAEYQKDGVILFNEIKKILRKEENAREFLKKFKDWSKDIHSQVIRRKYMNTKGNTIAKGLAAVVGLILPIVLIISSLSVLSPGFEVVFSYFRVLMISCVVVSIVVLSMKRTVFAKWTKDGLLYYLKWKNFERYLTDFSALSMHPPQSVAIWDEYLIYATALGVAKEVRKNLKKLYPEPPSTPVTTAIYYNPTLIDEIGSIRLIAKSTVSRISSSSSGGTRIGGGSGGSRVGVG